MLIIEPFLKLLDFVKVLSTKQLNISRAQL